MAECTLIFKKICHELSLTVAVSTQDCSSSVHVLHADLLFFYINRQFEHFKQMNVS